MNEIHDNPKNNVDSETDIAEVKSPSNHNYIAEYMVLNDGDDNTYTVPAIFYETVLLLVKESIPGLIPGEKYKCEWLCGDAFWKLLSAGEQKMAGRCVASMVVNRLLPLCFVKTKHEYPKHYELIQH